MLLSNVNLPSLNREGMTVDRKIAAVLEYAHSLKQQLDYVLGNLDESNLSSALTGSLSATNAAVRKLSEADFGQQLSHKLNTKDVKNDLEATGAGKALDAYQGRVLKTMVEQRVKSDELTDLIYPVGSVYISVSAESPASLFGGTWERIAGRFLLAAGDAYAAGTTGGEAAHTLTVSEMPAHTHTYLDAPHLYAERDTTAGSIICPNGSESANNMTYNTGSTGGNAAHNNMPPYLAVYMWKRTA